MSIEILNDLLAIVYIPDIILIKVKVPPINARILVMKSYHRLDFVVTITSTGDKSYEKEACGLADLAIDRKLE